MRICDRKGCSENHVKTILVVGDGLEFDLCATHNNEFMEYIRSPVMPEPSLMEKILPKKKKKRRSKKK